MNEIQCLTKEHIFLIHSNAIQEFGGSTGFFNNTEGKVESILAQQYPYFGIEKYPTIFLKAAMLWYFFTKGHCFVDGNKRVGMQSAIVFLTINGYNDCLENHEGLEKTIEICISKHERDSYISSLASWLEERFIKNEFDGFKYNY